MDANAALVVCVALMGVGALAMLLWRLYDGCLVIPFTRVPCEPTPPKRGFEVIMHKRRGFSFAEILFAVAILGVGFILVAAMFPVALSQTRSTVNETAAAALVRGAFATVEMLATDANLPPTEAGPLPTPAPVGLLPATMPTDGWFQIRGSLISNTDQKLAWVPMYRREFGASAATVYVIVAESLVNDSFTPGDTIPAWPSTGINLLPRPIVVDVTTDGTGPTVDQYILFDSTSPNIDAVAPGTHVVIAADNLALPDTGRMNGRIYRVGELADVSGLPADRVAYEIQPGFDFLSDPDPDNTGPQTQIDGLTGADALILGRHWNGTTYEGPAMDVAIYARPVAVRH